MFTIQYMIYIFISKAASCMPISAHARLRALFLSTLKLMLSFWDNRSLAENKANAHSTSSDYVFSCPCNKETPKTSKPLRQGDNQTDSSITQVMQEDTDQVISLLPAWHNLGANISRIVKRRYMPNDWLSHDSRLPYCIITNWVWLLLQDRLRPLCVVYNRQVVAIDKYGASQGHTSHSQLVTEAHDE
jgi:hypothetical protein